MSLDSLDSWSDAALNEQPLTVTLRRSIHADPELGLDCPRTRDKLKAALAGLPLAIRDSRRTSGFVALLDGTGPGDSARTVLLRGDMDALPIREATGLDFRKHHLRRDARLWPRQPFGDARRGRAGADRPPR